MPDPLPRLLPRLLPGLRPGLFPRLPGIAYGGDYNPEQWPAEVWPADVRLMREAGVNLVTVGVFAWALLEPAEGRYAFDWLDRVLDLLHDGGVAVDLATATASPPPWFSARYPETLPVTYDGRRMWPGGRQAFCPSSPIYRTAAVRLAGALAERYRDHPALALWHVHNEYGDHNAHCFCDVSAAAFRRWLQRRYGDLDTLNAAWATAFWSQRYGDWSEINPPRLAPAYVNPTQQLDYWRFSSDELLDCFRAERDVLHRVAPGVPVTTNFMTARFKPVDYWTWAPEVDVVSTDHYLLAEDPDNEVDLAMAADLTRSLAGGRPWLVMEHSTSAVNWQPRNLAKTPGQLRRNSLTHVARGADGVLFFQWRASAAGAEKFHSAMLPHAGTDTRVWREARALGAELGRLADVRGSVVPADVAIVWDYQAWWAVELDAHPSVDVRYLDQVRAWYDALWRAGVTVDFARPDADLGGYRLVLAPSLYLVSDAAAANIASYVYRGGRFGLGFFSGIVDPADHVRLGGYPGAFRDVVGVRVEEFYPLRAGARVRLSDGSTGSVWTELLRVEGAEVLASYADGDLPGAPALTRNRHGAGTAWYVTTALDPASLRRLLAEVCADAGVHPVAAVPAEVEVVRRTGEAASWLFAMNHGTAAVDVPTRRGSVVVGAGEVCVTREDVGARMSGNDEKAGN